MPTRDPPASCAAKTRSGTPCKKPAGWGTDHVGQGRCKLHGGATPIKHGRYSSIQRPRLRELLDAFENDPEPLNLLPEVKLLRALLTDFVERYEEVTEATLAWHNSWGDKYREAVDTWREQMLRALESGGWQDTEADDLKDPPDPLEYMTKPRQMLDITAAAGLVDKVGAMVDRIEKYRREGSITLETLDRVLEQLGVEVVHALQEEVRDGVTRTAVLAAVERRWADIRLDPTTRARTQASPRTLN